jgi:hypothetical protein
MEGFWWHLMLLPRCFVPSFLRLLPHCFVFLTFFDPLFLQQQNSYITSTIAIANVLAAVKEEQLLSSHISSPRSKWLFRS